MKINNYDFESIGKRVQQARKTKRYTQAELAEIIDMSAKNLSSLERGTTGISIPTLMALCKALDTSSDYILFGNDNTPTKIHQTHYFLNCPKRNKGMQKSY